VINERGPADLQMKDVAEAAGLATGSVYYYYENADELLRHVHALAYERYFTSRAEAVAVVEGAREKIVTMVNMGLPRPEDQPLSLALYQVAVAKARDPHHADLITDLCGQQVRLYESLLTQGAESGVFNLLTDAHRIAENIIALEDGYGLGLCTGNHDYDFAEAVRSVLEAVSVWTQCPNLLRNDKGRRPRSNASRNSSRDGDDHPPPPKRPRMPPMIRPRSRSTAGLATATPTVGRSVRI
jgi:AcrR family transcriptional regulator